MDPYGTIWNLGCLNLTDFKVDGATLPKGCFIGLG